MVKKAFMYVILAGILWGSSGVFVRFLTPYGFSAINTNFCRSFVSFICLLCYGIFCDRSILKVSFKEILLFAGSGISFFSTASCYFYSLQVTSISTAVVLMYTAPVMVMIFSVAFLGEKITKLKFISVVCMIIGCGLVSGIIGGMKFDFWGILIGLLSGISFSVYNILTRINMKNNSNPVSANLYCFLFASVCGFCISDIGEIYQCIATSPQTTILLLISLGFVTAVLPYVFYTIALKEIPAGTASSLAIMEPMSATVFSIILFGEKLTVSSGCGIVLILGAVYLLSINKE